MNNEIFEEISKISLTLSFKNKQLQPSSDEYREYMYPEKLNDSVEYDFKCKLEALMAKGYGLNEEEIKYIFANFHKTSDYSDMLKDVIKYYKNI